MDIDLGWVSLHENASSPPRLETQGLLAWGPDPFLGWR